MKLAAVPHHIMRFKFFPVFYCPVLGRGRLFFHGFQRVRWRIAFIKTQSQPPSGGVNRESSEGRGVEGRGALPRHVPEPLQAGPCLASMADHRGRRGLSAHLCPARRDAGDKWPPSSDQRERWSLYEDAPVWKLWADTDILLIVSHDTREFVSKYIKTHIWTWWQDEIRQFFFGQCKIEKQ